MSKVTNSSKFQPVGVKYHTSIEVELTGVQELYLGLLCSKDVCPVSASSNCPCCALYHLLSLVCRIVYLHLIRERAPTRFNL